jgi:hypothetical protein
LCAYFAPKCLRIDVVDERALAIDLHHRQPLAVPGFEIGVASDVDLVELKGHVGADTLDDPASTLAQMAAVSVIERDPTDRCREWS